MLGGPAVAFWRRLYMVGFDTVPAHYEGKIRGPAPTFNDMPFDFLSAYAAPTGVVTGAGAADTQTQFLA